MVGRQQITCICQLIPILFHTISDLAHRLSIKISHLSFLRSKTGVLCTFRVRDARQKLLLFFYLIVVVIDCREEIVESRARYRHKAMGWLRSDFVSFAAVKMRCVLSCLSKDFELFHRFCSISTRFLRSVVFPLSWPVFLCLRIAVEEFLSHSFPSLHSTLTLFHHHHIPSSVSARPEIT